MLLLEWGNPEGGAKAAADALAARIFCVCLGPPGAFKSP
jgi:hypothetical protein